MFELCEVITTTIQELDTSRLLADHKELLLLIMIPAKALELLNFYFFIPMNDITLLEPYPSLKDSGP